MARVIRSVVIGFVLFFALDGLLFRSSLYWTWVMPDSSIGMIRRSIQSITDAEQIAGRKIVLVVGDSRVGEGFSFLQANARAEELHSPTRYAGAGVPGLNIKPMYYFMRYIDPEATRFSAIVVMVGSLAAGRWGGRPNCDRELSYVHPLVTPADFFDLIDGCTADGSVERTLRALLSAGSNYRADLHAFALNPAARIKMASDWNRLGAQFSRGYPGRDQTLDGLTLDPSTGALTIPAKVAAPEAAALRTYVRRLRKPFTAPAGSRQYIMSWLERMVERYAATGTPVILAQVPRGPLHAAMSKDEEVDPFLAELQRRGKITILSASLLRELEQPHFFFDQLHVNKYGREVMSEKLATGLAGLDFVH